MIALFGLYILLEFEKINQIDHELKEATEISQFALDFSVENYHTQLEVWEYAYEPSQKRLDAFEFHKKTMNQLLEKLNDVVNEEEVSIGELYHALYENAGNDMDEINDNLLQIEDDWILLFDAVGKYQKAREAGVSDEELKRLDSIAHQMAIQNEDLFDGLEFNRKIDSFVYNQGRLADNLEIEHKKIISNFTNTLFIIIPAIIAFGLITGFIISRKITIPIKKLESASIEMLHGNLDVDIPLKGSNEVINLIKAFNKMRDSMKEKIELEKNKLAVEQEKSRNAKLTAIGTLSARLAHDLRNPLHVIKTSLMVISLKNKNHQISDSEKRIERAMERMTNQIDGILDFVKESDLKITNTSIQKCFTNVMPSISIPTDIKIIISEKDYIIQADFQKLEIVFANLIRNAIESIAINKGEINIAITDSDEHVIIKFSDTGTDIVESELSKIFEPLYTTKQTGTGLGLISCKTIVEQHKGTIIASSNPKLFTITLPKHFTG